MNDAEGQRIVSVLEGIRENQRLQLEREAETVQVLRELVALEKQRFERAERINQRAEAIQEKSARLMTAARRFLFIGLPILVALMVLWAWLQTLE